jgi:uncharacterized protein (TIGR02145 family)
MKHSTLLLFLITTLCGFSQSISITLTFQAIDSVTLTPVALDSVRVHNMTENCDTVLYDSVSVLTMNAGWPVGISDPRPAEKKSLDLQQEAPGTEGGACQVWIFLKQPDQVTLSLIDQNGKKITKNRGAFSAGWTRFAVLSRVAGVYLLSASTGWETVSIPVVCRVNAGGENRITCPESSAESATRLKSSGKRGGFVFYLGNQLRYTAHAHGYISGVMIDHPVSSETYTFEMPPVSFVCGSSQVSYEGITYNTVQIGTQCWFRENLNVGTRINVTQNQSNNGIIEKFCYTNNEAKCAVYGGLYQWSEMMQYSTIPGARGICPSGWHVPTDAEWSLMTNYLGGYLVAGGNLKETEYLHWNSPNTGATNSSGFTALAGGWGYLAFDRLNEEANIWTSTQASASTAWQRILFYDSADVYNGTMSISFGMSCRCIRD